jgi:2-polyprenyl-6-methoxyphenol hydroxylase-like FAD-dependent oxidoreductase
MWAAIVAGAGPAGALAAIALARSGHRALLADRIGDRVDKIGEALPEAAGRLLRSLDLPVLDTGGAHAAIGGILSSWNSDELMAIDAFRHPDGQGWRLDRARFDADLRAAAAAAGASFRADRVRSVRRQGDGWEIGFEDGRVEHARWIVDATGRNRLLARRLGVPRVRGPRLVAFYARGTADAALRTDRTLIEAVPEGWWYAARLPSGAPIAGFHTDARTAAVLRSDAGAWRGDYPGPGTSRAFWTARGSTGRARWMRAAVGSANSAGRAGSRAAMPPCASTLFRDRASSRPCMAASRPARRSLPLSKGDRTRSTTTRRG